MKKETEHKANINNVNVTISNPSHITVENQPHLLPTILSFCVPGAGQLLKGHVKKALIYFFGSIILWIFWSISFYNAVISLTITLMIVLFCVWLHGIYDAYNSNRN